MSIVHCKLPKAGLGNQLFPLMKAYLFAQINDLPIVVTGYNTVKIGPYLRGEKSKRKYNNYFQFQKNIVGEWMSKWQVNKNRFRQVVAEPVIEPVSATTSTLYEYAAIPHWSDYFAGLKDHRRLVKDIFYSVITESIKREVEKLSPPVIGVHIRMGDFRKMTSQEDFEKMGAVRTPEQYFVEVIQQIRALNGAELPVTVFTDGYRREFETLFSLPGVSMAGGNKDIVDMLLLSLSKIIVTSAGSTFSYWSGFLSEVPIIRHPAHMNGLIRKAEPDNDPYEGPLDPHNTLLTDVIKKTTP